MSDFDEIWHNDAVQLSSPFRPLKIEISKFQDGGGRFPEKFKNRDISATV